jgi:galactose mutarotase-like enzyme
MTTTPADWIRLKSEALSAEIDPQGAQLSILRDAQGRDLLWDGDPAFWGGRAPVLFPIVGTLNGGVYRWRGKLYALPRHGFARGRRFALVRNDMRQALFRLRSDEASRALFPFEFELDLAFRLAGVSIGIVATVRNVGRVPMPASLGFHPALRWPLPGGATRAAHVLEFDAEEPAPIRRLDAAGLLKADALPTPVVGRRLVLDDALFAQDVVIFDSLKSKRVTFGAREGTRIQVTFPDATHLGLWTRPGAGFLCIEPWRGVADPVDFDADFDAKPGVFTLQPGGETSLTMIIATLAAP